MAEALTYSSLLTDVATYSERSSDQVFVDQIPRLLMLAENKIAREVRNLGLVVYATGQFVIANPIMAKPARWRQTVAFKYVNTAGEWVEIFPRSYDYCRIYWPNPSSSSTPEYYADYDYEHYFIVAPPDNTYTFEIAYHERPTPLDAAHETNWTTQYAPQLLLYACMVEASTFLKNWDKVQTWKALYDIEVAGLANEEIARMNDDRASERKQA